MESKFKGLGVALVTPFDERGEIDFEALGRIVDSAIAGGVDYLVALGTTAETPTLTHAERASTAGFVRDRNAGRVPLIVGMGGNDTAKLISEFKEFDPEGLDAVLTVVPYYNKPTQEGLFRHFRAVAEASPLPVVMYNIPGRTGVNMSAETTLRIARELPNVIGIKEASGDISQMQEVVKGAPKDFLVVSGDDAMTLSLMSTGGHGVISVIANAFPDRMAKMVHTAQTSVARAQAFWADFEDLCPLLFVEGNPTGIKTVLSLRGVCRPDVRLPLVEGSEKLRRAITEVMGEL